MLKWLCAKLSERRELIDAIKAQTNVMDELRQSIDMAVDEVRSVQTYGLRINK